MCKYFLPVLLLLACPPLQFNLFGQAPSDVNRWTGSTALSQTQGFNQGDPLRLTWGFASLGTSINDSAFSGYADANNDLQTRLNTIYGNQATWQPLFQSTFDRWSSISGLSYQFEANDDGAPWFNPGPNPGVLGVRADLRIGGKPLDGNNSLLAYNYFPNSGSEMVIDTNDNFYDNVTNNSIRLRNVIAHEHGHGLGMPHVESNNSNALMEPFINTTFDGPQFHDILAAQRAYGDVNEKGLGNDTALLATNLGTLSNGGTISIGNDARDLLVSFNETDFFSIDDTSDIDFFRFSISQAGNLTINLESLGLSYNASPQSGVQTLFNPKSRSDLSLSLFGSDGVTLLSSVNATGLGGDELIGNFFLGSIGNYFVRVNGVENADASTFDAQFFGLSMALIAAVPEPSSIVLVMSVLAGLGCRRFRR
jgi:serralysin